MSTHNYLDKTGLGQVWGKIKALITQSDWEEDDSSKNSYVQNRPAIRAGEGENSIVEGQIEQDETAAIYTIYVSKEYGANDTFTYTTEDTLPVVNNLKNYGIWYDDTQVSSGAYSSILDIDTVNQTIKIHRTYGNAAITNLEIKIFYKYTIFSGDYSHCEGRFNSVIGNRSHAEGNHVQTFSNAAHGEGYQTKAFGQYSHVEGRNAIAQGISSHAEGSYTIASGTVQHVQGKYNIEDSTNTYAHIVGNGSSSARSNAHTLDWNGNAWYAGKVSAGTVANPANPIADNDLATKAYVDDSTASITDEKLSTDTIGNDVYYPIVGTNTSSATTKYIDSTGFKYDATSSTNGYARLYLGNGTVSGTEGSKYGRLMIYGTTAYGVTLDSGSPTENRTISLPNKNGTIVITSDVLTKNNTTSYTPTSDYNPATKKYVDDNIPQPEDDVEILNLLSQYDYPTPISDADGNVITDVDNVIILG